MLDSQRLAVKHNQGNNIRLSIINFKRAFMQQALDFHKVYKTLFFYASWNYHKVV